MPNQARIGGVPGTVTNTKDQPQRRSQCAAARYGRVPGAAAGLPAPCCSRNVTAGEQHASQPAGGNASSGPPQPPQPLPPPWPPAMLARQLTCVRNGGQPAGACAARLIRPRGTHQEQPAQCAAQLAAGVGNAAGRRCLPVWFFVLGSCFLVAAAHNEHETTTHQHPTFAHACQPPVLFMRCPRRRQCPLSSVHMAVATNNLSAAHPHHMRVQSAAFNCWRKAGSCMCPRNLSWRTRE